MSYLNPSIVHPSIPVCSDMMRSTGIEGLQKRLTLRQLTFRVKEQIEYDILKDSLNADDLDNIVETGETGEVYRHIGQSE